MSSNKISFEDTLNWAEKEIKYRSKNKFSSISIKYLIIGAVLIFIIVIVILYFTSLSPNKKGQALSDMKQNISFQDNNINDNNDDIDDDIENDIDDDIDNNIDNNDINDDINDDIEYSYYSETDD